MEIISELKKISIIKTLLVNIKYVLGTNKLSCLICKKTVCDFNKTSRIEVNNGRLTFNRSFNRKNPFTSLVTLRKNSKIIVNGKFNFYQGSIISLGDNAILELGNNSYLNGYCKLVCHNQIHIGNNTIIADNVTIRDSDMHSIIGKETEMSKPIHIGNHVWIGDGATILKGVTIGDGAIIGARALVTQDIPARALAVGVPAKAIKDNVEWE